MRNLGKELAKKDEDGTLRWEAVLDELHVDLTMEQEEIISKSVWGLIGHVWTIILTRVYL